MADAGDGDELLLEAEAETEEPPAAGSRWLASDAEPATVDEDAPKPAPMAGGGTLFERMSNIARGAAKVEPDTGAKSDPLDIPRFLNRQNNQ
jgi:cell division protein FtsZ